MLLHEWIAIAYFVSITAATIVKRGRAAIVAATSLAAIAAIMLVARLGDPVRTWWPIVTILAAYWVGGRAFTGPMTDVEAWLARLDRRWLHDSGALARIGAWPRVVLEYLEGVYFGCFLVVPGGLLVLIAGGHEEYTSRYWTAVVVAELVAFSMLPWIQTRPPWALEAPGPLARRGLALGRLARLLVDRATIGVNTFPSGHAAASVAAALAVSGAMPMAGGVLLLIAASITLAAVVGRYHYAADGVAGVLLGVGAWMVSRAAA
jgi:membrane-associated phospholipid phosphatase